MRVSPGSGAAVYKQQHTDSCVLLIFYQWAPMSLWMKALWDLIKAQSLCPQRGRPGPAVWALGALQRRRWVLSERVHGVWLCRVSSLHQSPPPWHLASPPCGWFSVNHQLPHAGSISDVKRPPKGGRKSLTLYGRSLILGEEKLSLSTFPCWVKCSGETETFYLSMGSFL